MPKTSSQDDPQQWGIEDFALFGLFDSTDKVEEKHKAVARFIAIRKFFENEEYRLGRLSSKIFNQKRDTKIKLFMQNLAQLLSPDDDLLQPLLAKPENTIEKMVLALSALTEPHRVDLQTYGLVDFFFVWFDHRPTFKIPADGLTNYIELMDAACEIVKTDRSKALHDKMGSIATYKNYKFKKDREAQEQNERPRKKPKHDHDETLLGYRAVEKPASIFLEPRSKPLTLNEESLTPSIKHDLEQVPNVHPKCQISLHQYLYYADMNLTNVFLLGEPLLSRVHETLGGRSPLAQGLMASGQLIWETNTNPDMGQQLAGIADRGDHERNNRRTGCVTAIVPHEKNSDITFHFRVGSKAGWQIVKHMDFHRQTDTFKQ